MIPVTSSAGKTVAVVGLGASGKVACRALLAGGAQVAAWDDSETARAAAADEDIPIIDLAALDWSRFASLVLAPGIPLTHPEPHWTVRKARAAGVEVIGDTELLFRERARQAPEAKIVAVTGTNGKSTTTALLAHVLRNAGHDTQMGGNIGVPALALAPPLPGRYYVVELSSFQIDLTPSLAADVGVLLNITPDHLDRHGTLAQYAAVKERMVTSAKLAVIGVNTGTDPDDLCQHIVSRLEAAEVPHLLFARTHPAVINAVYFEDKRLKRQISLGTRWCLGETLSDLSAAAGLHGAHNGENAAAAFLSCEWLGLPHDVIAQGLKSFPGLAHRMQPVATLAKPDGGEVLFINDSKATNADSAAKALDSFDDGVFWIAGGRAKDGGIDSLQRHFSGVAHAFVIGEAAEDFAKTIGACCPVTHAGTVEAAVERAASAALQSSTHTAVVLLSPACASFDQYRNFELRGDAFRQAVARLPGIQLRDGANI